MRRLAKHSRNDQVRSRRDYQTILDREGASFQFATAAVGHLVFRATVTELHEETPYIAVGGYMKTDVGTTLSLTVELPNTTPTIHLIRSARQWGRFGFVVPSTVPGEVRLTIDIPENVRHLDLWGLDLGAVVLPEAALDTVKGDPEVLTASHLAPETYYLPHVDAINLDLVEDEWDGLEEGPPSAPIKVKKCAYCQRLLPIDPKRPSALAFHKHNAKISGHQNECRACKKWRINDTFNPRRTTDQLHESSVITRERQLFLREPEILARIKDRQGAGLKSIIWERFDRKCFRCNRSLTLDEVELDHTRPMAYLWPIDEHATCLCAPCNNHKKERFPVDVYDDDQLRRLASITGLSLRDLTAKQLNPIELARITTDISRFAREWDAFTFNATARKVRELRPDVELFDLLQDADPDLHDELRARLTNRRDRDD